MHGHQMYMCFPLYNWGGLYEGRIALSTGYSVFFNRCKNAWKVIKLRSTDKRKLYVLYTKVKSGLYMSTDNSRKLEKSLSGFRSAGPLEYYYSVWRATIPLYVPDSQINASNVSDCNSKQFCCYQGFIYTLRLHQMRCCVRHYCTITLTAKSRDDGLISHAANLNKRSKTEYREANEPQVQNKQKNIFSNLLYWQELIANTVFSIIQTEYQDHEVSTVECCVRHFTIYWIVEWRNSVNFDLCIRYRKHLSKIVRWQPGLNFSIYKLKFRFINCDPYP
jgi:hypothetical protein